MILAAVAAARALVVEYWAWVRLLLVIAGAFVVAAIVVTIQGWRADSLRLDAVEADLQAEVRCAPGSHCLRRAHLAAERGAAAVAEARRTAAEAAQRAQTARDAEARAENDRLTAALNVAQAAEEQWRARFRAAASAAGSSCEAWARSVVPCPVE